MVKKLRPQVLHERIVELPPVKETTEEWDALEERIKRLFREEIYYPLLAELNEPKNSIQNAKEDDLIKALKSGRVTFSRGTFSGRFNSTISKTLKSLGAKWDRKSSTWKLLATDLPRDVRETVAASAAKFEEKLAVMDRKLAQILPEEVADKLKSADLFDRSLWKTEKSVSKTLDKLSIAPKLSAEGRKKVADEWQNNMKLWIKDFTEEKISKLRREMKKTIFAGNRYGSAIETIQKSYGVSASKAKFLARQETNLLMAKYKETRYTEAGVNEYKWGCVSGTAKHPVRPAHKALEGKIFRWDDPPITTAPGEPVRRNNPGQDYNCRCFAKPIVRFKA